MDPKPNKEGVSHIEQHDVLGHEILLHEVQHLLEFEVPGGVGAVKESRLLLLPDIYYDLLVDVGLLSAELAPKVIFLLSCGTKFEFTT